VLKDSVPSVSDTSVHFNANLQQNTKNKSVTDASNIYALQGASQHTPHEKLHNLIGGLRKIKEQHKSHRPILNPVINFLPDYGVPIKTLISIEKRASRIGVSPEQVLISKGIMSEENYLDLFADEFGYTRATPATRLMHPCSFSDAAEHCMMHIKQEITVNDTAQHRANQTIIVPKPKALNFLMSGRAQQNCSRLQLASSREFQSLVLADASGALLEDITNLNLKRAGQVSASSSLSKGHIVSFWCIALATAMFGVFSPALGAKLLGVGTSLVFLSVIYMRLAAMIARIPKLCAFKALNDKELPVYSVLIALHREDRVINKLCRSLLAFDYPPEKLDIKFLLEEGDDLTRRAIELQNLPSHFSILTLPKGNPKTKPRALNAGLMFAKGDLICVFDAEDEPEASQLKKAAERFAASDMNLACLQASLVPDNVDDGVLQAMFALEYATLFDVIKNGLSNLQFPMPLGGTSNHFRMETLKKVGGWDAWNVTEDAELGLRFARLGFRTERLQSVTYEEAPPTLKAWFNQRRRWSKGWMQTAIAHSTKPIENIKNLGFWRVAQSFFMITGSVFCMLMFPLGVLAFILRCCNGHDFFCGSWIDASIDALTLVVTTFGALALFIPSILALRQRKLERFWWIIPLIPLYLVGVTCASWMAAFDLMVRPFHWIKTEHGFAKTSNRARSKMQIAYLSPP
jgi:glycosyltransferase XagB